MAGGDPVAAVGVAPRDRALVQHLGGDVGEPLPVLGSVPVEVVVALLPLGVAAGDGFRGHAGASCPARG